MSIQQDLLKEVQTELYDEKVRDYKSALKTALRRVEEMQKFHNDAQNDYEALMKLTPEEYRMKHQQR